MSGCLASVPQLELKKVSSSNREGHWGPPAFLARCFLEADGEGKRMPACDSTGHSWRGEWPWKQSGWDYRSGGRKEEKLLDTD